MLLARGIYIFLGLFRSYDGDVMKQTIWVMGDQLNRQIGALKDARSETHRVLMIESHGKISSQQWHIQSNS